MHPNDMAVVFVTLCPVVLGFWLRSRIGARMLGGVAVVGFTFVGVILGALVLNHGSEGRRIARLTHALEHHRSTR